jgi:4-hydroxybenzoate polyprenyltransferase
MPDEANMRGPAEPDTPTAASVPNPDGQVLRGGSLLVRYLNFVKFPHTLFALPFALLGVVAAAGRSPLRPGTIGLAVLAFTAARWAALGFNMIADLRFDRQNPRNLQRELPRGALTIAQAWGSVVVASTLFLGAAIGINPLCARLAPLALGWVLTYSYAKRFTDWPHLWLGLSLAIAPVGGWIAVTGAWSDPWWTLPSVTLAVTTWVAGFDIFYSLPDEAFDRAQGLRSLVARYGVRRSLRIARLLHGTTVPALALFGLGAGLGPWYFTGVALALGILAYEHWLIRADDLSRLDAAFFTMNAVMSSTVFAFALLDRMLE